ncbi:ribonuclease Z [Gracilibacillus boraciitolerans JCM 21714]|uniref:Ribonuclease Z n=1 Tax=Gracilibacillus boraciitolerans JCM 21714 TaxID=1298598 RepID=W4VDJ7_9BACI|nr:ribonuclease Z [Gracilibacillus boraciitolerans]GAE91287.1 ribonuclease Z [Gracilibacillus boraciitolerans JCM 21714]
MKVTFLGTGGAGLPSKNRNVTSIILDLLQETNNMWMFDCGESTQHQILYTSIKPRKINKIFITHLHGDHIYGLPGFLSSRSFQGGVDPVTIFGPAGIKSFINTSLSVNKSKPSYPIDIIEIKEGIIYEDDQFIVKAKRLEHVIESFGFRIDEKESKGSLLVDKLKADGIYPGPIYQLFKSQDTVKLTDGTVVPSSNYIGDPKQGKSVAILGDTRAKTDVIPFVANVDLLVHEATFAKGQEQLAYDYFHSTTDQAATIAARAQVKKIILTHISSRFQKDDTVQLETEAKQQFENATIAEDFYTYPL